MTVTLGILCVSSPSYIQHLDTARCRWPLCIEVCLSHRAPAHLTHRSSIEAGPGGGRREARRRSRPDHPTTHHARDESFACFLLAQKMVYLGVTCTYTVVHATRRLPTICQRPLTLSHRAWLSLDPQRPRSQQKAHAACLSEPPPAVLTAGRRRTSRPRVGRPPACAVRCATARRARG